MKKRNSRREKIKQSTKEIKQSTKEFNSELKKSLNTAIVAAFGFLIALVWRHVITEYVNKVAALSPVKGKLISAFIITLVGVTGILLATRFLKSE